MTADRWTTNIDFSTHDLGAPLQEPTTNGRQSSLQDFIRKGAAEITDGPAPASQGRGLVRTGCARKHFRDNLLEF